jgi:hypothetical protein
VSKWDNLKIVPVLEGQVASGALPKTGAERVCGNGLSQHVAVSELEDDGHRIGRCASRFLCLLRHDDLHPSTPGIVCVIPGIGALWLFQHELLGISIDAGTLTMPTRQISWMLALSFRRRTLSLSEVRRLTLSERWFGFEVVNISGDFG